MREIYIISEAYALLTVAPRIDTRTLEHLFRHHVLKMLLGKGKITKDMIALLDKWRHTGDVTPKRKSFLKISYGCL
ncbi:MAG: hypothetical protein V1714_05090 [Pseudomonadota bacterium]